MVHACFLHIVLKMAKMPEHRDEKHVTRFLKLGKRWLQLLTLTLGTYIDNIRQVMDVVFEDRCIGCLQSQ